MKNTSTINLVFAIAMVCAFIQCSNHSSDSVYEATAIAEELFQVDSICFLESGVNQLQAIDDTTIYASGFFYNNKGRHYLAKWNGKIWEEVGNMNLEPSSNIRSFKVFSQNEIYATGDFTDNTDVVYIAKWDGKQWNHIAHFWGSESANNNMAVLNENDIYVTGAHFNPRNTSVCRWNGKKWSEVGKLPQKISIHSLIVRDSNSIFIMGEEYKVDFVPYCAHWDGKNWNRLNISSRNITSMDSDDKGNIYFGLSYSSNDTANFSHIVKWDGKSLTGINIGNEYYSIVTLLVVSENEIYASVCLTNYGSKFIDEKAIVKWDGFRWRKIPGTENTGEILTLSKFGNNLYYSGISLNDSIKQRITRVNSAN
jgi:hypothetical protein